MQIFKKLKIILFLVLFFKCNKKEKKVVSDFTEKDAYEIINNHFIKEVTSNSIDSIIYWNNRQLKSPEYKHTFIASDTILTFNKIQPPFPLFTKKYWKNGEVKGVKLFDWKEYNSFFKENDSVDLEALWNLRFNGKLVHNVSFPIFNPKTKIAVIRDYKYSPFLHCATGLDNLYYYKKTKKGWNKLH